MPPWRGPLDGEFADLLRGSVKTRYCATLWQDASKLVVVLAQVIVRVHPRDMDGDGCGGQGKAEHTSNARPVPKLGAITKAVWKTKPCGFLCVCVEHTRGGHEVGAHGSTRVSCVILLC